MVPVLQQRWGRQRRAHSASAARITRVSVPHTAASVRARQAGLDFAS
jgi:hypothetical protein